MTHNLERADRRLGFGSAVEPTRGLCIRGWCVDWGFSVRHSQIGLRATVDHSRRLHILDTLFTTPA